MSNKNLLSGLDQINAAADSVGDITNSIDTENLTEKMAQVKNNISHASNVTSTIKNVVGNIQQLAQSQLNFSSASSLTDNIASVASLIGNENVAAKAAKIQQTASQITQTISTAGDVIHRVQKISNKLTQSKSLTTTNTSSPIELLTALFNRSPSGLQFTLETANLPPLTFSVIHFELQAQYNRLYTLNISACSSNPAIPSAAVLDNHAVLSIWQDGVLQQTLSGMVAEFTQGNSGFRSTHYHFTLYPDLWRATLRHNSRIFQQQDIQTILSTLLEENKVRDYAFFLRHTHLEREFCVQYQETDFDFFQRLCAEEGILYYFEQLNGQTRLILTDDAATLTPSVSLPYNLHRQAQRQEHCVTSFRRIESLRHSLVRLKDYTFKKPNWEAQFDARAKDTEHQHQTYEYFDYPGRFKDSRGKHYAQYRLDGLRQDAHLVRGNSNSPHLQVGKLFDLYRHRNEQLNTAWQIIALSYRGEQPQAAEVEAGDNGTTLHCHFECIPNTQTWRPSQRTKPKVDGPQMAIVVGPKGEEIYTDNFGRIRLQFLWDRKGQFDDHSSCWIRVTQPWAGKGWGMMAIPRVGHEVVVNFLDGDPDQPIVTGRTYHANNISPAALPANKTQMHLMSQTYKGSGYNGMMMEDSPGAQRLDFQAQKDMTTNVLNDKTTIVNNEHTETVNKAQNITVQGDRTKQILQQELVSLNKCSINQVGLKRTLVAQKQLIVSSQTGDITLTAGGARLSLSKDGTVVISGSGTVTINGQESVYINNGMVNTSLAAAMLILLDQLNTFNTEELGVAWQTLTNQIAKLRGEGNHALADQLDRQRKALQQAALARAAYSPIGSPPPPGWKEISNNPAELAKYNLREEHFPKNQDFQARFFVPDPAVFGEDMKPTVAFRGTRFEKLEDWKNNGQQGVGLESAYYNQAVDVGKRINQSGNAGNMEFVGHSLGGGLASAASRASGAKATTFNAAGLNNITVERHTKLIPSDITAYRIQGEILTRLQEFDGVDPRRSILSHAGDATVAGLMPDAVYTTRYTLPQQTTDSWIPLMNSVDDHGMDKVTQALGNEFSETIKSLP